MALVKICGLSSEAQVRVAALARADRIGFVLVPASPRFVSARQAGAWAHMLRAGDFGSSGGKTPEAWVVAEWSRSTGRRTDGLMEILTSQTAISVVQLHGQETPEDVADMRRRAPSHVQVWKAIGVSEASDLEQIARYRAADGFLLDAKPPTGASRAGGFGLAFDWSILTDLKADKPWILSGGLNAANVAEAMEISGASAVDVSSGVEASPGVKDPLKVKAFIEAAKAGSVSAAAGSEDSE